MSRFAANVGFLYADRPIEERPAAARADGFEAIESAWPIVVPERFASMVRDAGVRVALLNMAAGDLAAGERGYPNDPARIDRWRADLEDALRLAAAIDCPTINVLAGNRIGDVPEDAQWACLEANLAWALPLAQAAGRRLVVEVLNPRDTPDYLVSDLDVAAGLVEPHRAEGLGLQFDTYHVGVMGLDVVDAFRRRAHLVDHIQVADVPGRHEPGTGSIDWRGFFGVVLAGGYGGAIGLEYHPRGATSEGLAWLPPEARRWNAAPFIFGNPPQA
ncbi:MAG TPA: TIM barrel protein [Candidatus Saccharimonadales bacterium]|nr:TIM barrel protein [Candidatus Saccharimonadales bacterium]